jgi:hypothetical protein
VPVLRDVRFAEERDGIRRRANSSEHAELAHRGYETLRQNPARFVVLPGQVFPEIETVVEERSGYVVVEKFGAGGGLVAAVDPRGHTETADWPRAVKGLRGRSRAASSLRQLQRSIVDALQLLLAVAALSLGGLRGAGLEPATSGLFLLQTVG